jgi:hypothetical protein
MNNWLKELIKNLEKWKCNNDRNTLEMTVECRDSIVEGLKLIDKEGL